LQANRLERSPFPVATLMVCCYAQRLLRGYSRLADTLPAVLRVSGC